MSYVVVLFVVFNDLLLEVDVRFVDIDGIVDYHFFLFSSPNDIYHCTCNSHYIVNVGNFSNVDRFG